MNTGFILYWPGFHVANGYYPTPEAGSWSDMHWKPVLSCTDLTFMQPTDIIGLLRQVVDDTGYVERAASLCIDVAVSQYFRVWFCNQNIKGRLLEILFSTFFNTALSQIICHPSDSTVSVGGCWDRSHTSALAIRRSITTRLNLIHHSCSRCNNLFFFTNWLWCIW